MNLYFKDKTGEIYIKEVEDIEQALISIPNAAKRLCPDLHIFYIRYWTEENGDTILDFGSHSEFFVLREG